MNTIKIEIPFSATDEEKLSKIIAGLEEINFVLEDIVCVMGVNTEEAEDLDMALDAIDSAIDSLDIALTLLDCDGEDEDEDDEYEEDNEGNEDSASSGIHISVKVTRS